MRILLGILKPIETTGTAPGEVVNYVFIPLAGEKGEFQVFHP